MQCLAFELEPLRKIVLFSIKLAMTGQQYTDDDSMGSTGIFTVDADGEDCEDMFLLVRSHVQIHLRVLITARAVFSS